MYYIEWPDGSLLQDIKGKHVKFESIYQAQNFISYSFKSQGLRIVRH